MSVRGNFPTFKYITVENLVITHNGTPYPVKNFYTNKKYVVWNVERQYQLEDTNIRPENSLLEYLVVINDNGKPTIVNHDELIYSFDQLTTGGSSSGEYNALKEKVDANTKKYNTISNTVDGMTQIIGSTEELKDGSIIYNLNKVKSDSKSYGVQIEEIKTKIDDKYKELRPILLSSLVEYLRTVSEYKLSFTDLKEDIEITSDELNRINNSKTDMMSKLELLNTNLDLLIGILEEVNDSTNIQTITNTKSQLSTLHNALISLGENALLNNKLEDLEKTNIIQKAYELSTYVGTVQNTCNNITVNGLGGVIYSVENELLMLKDSTTSSIKELNRNGDDLEQKYTDVKQTTDSIVEEVGQLTNKVGDLSSTSKKTIRSVVTYYTLSSSNSEIVGYDFSNIKPGDIIFQGNKDNDRYKGVYHVSIFYGLHDGENYVIECTSKSDVKKHKDDKTCGLCLRKWANVKKSDVVCIARPNSSSTNRVFDGASEFLTLAKAYYDKREQYFTYSQYNLWTNNSSKTWSETTVQGTDSPDGLYRHLDCSGYVNLVMRGIPFDEVFANESVFNAKDLSKRTNYTWTNELPRLAAEQCQEAENLGWDLKGSELHSVNEQWYTSVPENPDNFYIWSKNVTTYVDGTTAESEITCLSNDLALDGRSIVSTTPYYYESSSSTETIDGNWTTIPPRWSGEKYVWTKSLILYDDDTTDWTPESCVSGISSKTLELTTDAYTVAYNSDGTPKTTKAINLSAVQRNYKDTITWETVPSVTLNGSGTSRQLPVSTFNSIDRVTVKITSGGLSDEVTICKVQDGSQGIDGEDAYTILLTNPSHTFVGDSESALASNTTCGIIAYKGTTQVNTTVSTISNVPQGMTINISNNNSKTTVLNISVSTTLTSKNGTVTIPITVDGKSFTQLFTYSIAFGGVDGISVVSTDVEYGVSSSPTVKPTKWTTEYQSGGRDKYIWSRVRTAFSNGEINYSNEACISGMMGLQGEQGIPGKDAVTYYTWIKYADDINGGGISNDPTNKEYIGFAYNKTTATESNNPSDYTWSLIKGTDGVKGADGEDGKTFYTWIKYSDNADGANMYDIPTANTLYIGIATNKTTSVESTDKTQYTWSRFKGEQGVKGDKGETGQAGTDGRTTYFHIKYSSVANPTTSSQMTETPSAYIGTYVDYTEADSTDPKKYNWARFQGMQGEQGIPGINGEDGTSSYLHTKYSNDGGKTFTNNNGEDLGTYIGVCVDNNLNDPTTVSSYNWSKIEGREITSITEQYYLSTDKTTQPSETDSGWKDNCPTWEMGKYIWTRTKIVYANPTETVYKGYYVDTSWEAINDLQIGVNNFILHSDFTKKENTYSSDGSVEVANGVAVIKNASQFKMDLSKPFGTLKRGDDIVLSSIATLTSETETIGLNKFIGGNIDVYSEDYNSVSDAVKKLKLNMITVPVVVEIADINSSNPIIPDWGLNRAKAHLDKLKSLGLITKDTRLLFEPHPIISDGSVSETEYNPTDKSTFFSKWKEEIVKGLNFLSDYEFFGIYIGTNFQMFDSGESNIPYWETLANELRKLYNNHKLIYRTNWWTTATWSPELTQAYEDKVNNPLWEKVDIISIAGYFELNASITPTVDELYKDITEGTSLYDRGQNIFAEVKRFHDVWNKPVMFGELGCPSKEYGAMNPWSNLSSNKDNQQVQANYFEAYNRAFIFKNGKYDNDWFLGYSIFTLGTPTSEYNVVDKLAQSVINEGIEFIENNSATSINCHINNKESNTTIANFELPLSASLNSSKYKSVKLTYDGSSSSELIFNMPPKTTLTLSKPMLSNGTKSSSWMPSSEDVRQNVIDVENALSDLDTSIKDAFGDDIVNDAEAKAIASNIQVLTNEKADIDREYSTIYANTNLVGVAKTNLSSAKTAYDSAHASLISGINTATVDGKITDAERNSVNSFFSTYRIKLADYKQRVQEALDSISSQKVEDIEDKVTTLTDNLSKVEKKADEITNYVGKNTRYGKIRYIRDYLNGSTANGGNHWVEIQVYQNGKNIASGKTVTSNATPNTGTLSLVTNEDTTTDKYVAVDTRIGGTTEYKNYAYVQVDLGAIYTDINKIKVWHYHGDTRQYNHLLEVSSDGTTWYSLFDSEKQGSYSESANGRTYVIDGTYSESQIDQTANKINWVVKSGTSSSTMVLTDDFYSVITKNIRLKANNISLEGLVTANSKFKILTDGSMEATSGKFSGSITGGSININNIFKVNTSGKLTATGADIGGKITITDGSISLNNGVFVVSSLGNTKIGGDSPCTVNGYARARCEITSNGNIYVCSSTDSEVYTYFEEGKFYQHGTEGTVSITNGQVKISDGSTATTYGDGFISHNLSIMVDTPILNCTQSVYASEFRGQGNCVMKAPTGSGVYLLTNGASVGDDESTLGVKTIRYFKNTNGDYVFRTNSLNGSCYNGTSSYPWKQVAAKEFNNTSDRTLKENIVYLSNSSNYSLKSTQQLTVDDLYNFVKNDLPITMYNYIDDDSKKIGFIAQDIIYNADETDNIVGQLIVNPRAWNEEEGKLTYDINNYISVLAGALQMAMKKIDILEGKINGN